MISKRQILSNHVTPFGDEILIIDNFYSDPFSLRNKILSSNLKNDLSNFCGDTEIIRNQDIKKSLEILAHKIFRKEFESFSFFAKVKNDISWPHVDSYPIAGVVYFNKAHEINGGTGFFKHKISKVHKINYFQEKANYEQAALQYGFNSVEEFAVTHFCNRDYWELYDVIPMKFNRAVIYSSGLYHGSYSDPNFYSKNLPRISHNFFFKLKNVE